MNLTTFGILAHIYIVNHSETNNAIANGHSSPVFAKAENDDSDEDEDVDNGVIEAGAPEGTSALGHCRDTWLRVRSWKEEEEEEAQEEEGRGQW